MKQVDLRAPASRQYRHRPVFPCLALPSLALGLQDIVLSATHPTGITVTWQKSGRVRIFVYPSCSESYFFTTGKNRTRNIQRDGSAGTGSYPPLLQGLHRTILQTLRMIPRPAPCRASASQA